MPRLRPTKWQQNMWNALNKITMQEGGWITSAIYQSPLRLECPVGSALPDILTKAGYDLRPLGPQEKFLPTTMMVREHGRNTRVPRDQLVLQTVQLFTFDLPTPARTASSS